MGLPAVPVRSHERTSMAQSVFDSLPEDLCGQSTTQLEIIVAVDGLTILALPALHIDDALRQAIVDGAGGERGEAS